MNVYWNEQYCAPATHFETFKKSRVIVDRIALKRSVSSRVAIKDPSDTPGALQLAQQLIQNNLTPEYYRAVTTGEPRGLAKTNGFTWDEGIWQHVLHSTAGILCAIDDVSDNGEMRTCSLSSGLHHARPNEGKGWCTVNSLAIGALYARKAGRVVVLDLDAHCGGGTTRHIKGTGVLQIDLSTVDYDSYEQSETDDGSVLLMAGADDYFDMLASSLDALTAAKPDIVLYNAGVDVYPLLTERQVHDREVVVAEHLRGLGCKTILVMAGGYGDYTTIADMHVATIAAFVNESGTLQRSN